ncbi:hypothetical protein [Sulfurimonas marina]|uniref:SSD domain-containing protein n=1 Tax=Sulfurimonas marina TaxID=2590551 RepID=A0A7M1ATE6_9BACT|nr:hypothetical protein [Sulfurimonas marina]QOP40693.1 hypothetical protein FJR03_02620 [Sulfurimonas marina]
MYYHTPNINRYVDQVVKYRKTIIVFYFLLAALLAFLYQPKFLSSDELFWLKDSQELKKTNAQQFDTYDLSKLIVHIKNFDENSLEKLKNLHKQLLTLQGVTKVSSLFSNDFIETKKEDGSEMVVVVNSTDLDTLRLKKLVKEVHNDYCNVVDEEFQTFYFFIRSQQTIDLSSLNIPGEYEYVDVNHEINWQVMFFYAFIFMFVTLIVFRLLFRNYLAAIGGMILVGLSTILTFTTIIMVTNIYTIHVTMPFITISIALVDFLYFYYRWHVSQYKTNKMNALRKMLNRSMVPAMWTSVLTALGLGSLVFIDSDIIRLLSLSVIISSIIGYLLNLTFLPAYVSHFELKHTHVPYAKLGYLLASNELHYSKKYLYSFLTVTYLLLISGGYLIYSKSNNLFKLPVKNEQIELKVPYKQLDLNLIHSVEKFSNDLQERFEDELGDINSLATAIENLNNANTQTDELDQEALLQALFYMDLYNLSDKYFDESAINIEINLFDINKLELLEWLVNYKGIELYFIDNKTLLGISKYSQTLLLATSLFSALVIIGLITGWIFRSIGMVFVGFTINVIPILWFGIIISLLSIPLSLEMLIAMTISLGLASDATIHFAFKYFRLRYFGRSQKHTLEKVFFYAGIPVIIGSFVLILVFASLYFSQIHSLQLIGMYSAMLILLSLLTDLFVLPVMLLFVDRFKTQR